MALQVINPLQIPDWDDMVLATGKATVFHSSGWARVLHETYGYKPVYFTSFENGKLSSLMPMMEVDSILTGKRGVSLPFTDLCESIAPNRECFRMMADEAIECGRKRGWKIVEWRGNVECFDGVPPSSVHYTHTLDLSDGEHKVLSEFKSNTRRNINKAIKGGVRVKIATSMKAMVDYYELHCMTRKSHGLPPQPVSFFKRILEHMICGGNGFIALAYMRETCIAGAVYLHFGNQGIFKFGASNRKYHCLRPNNMVMWESLRECIRRGVLTFNFGRTEIVNEGLLQYKTGWTPNEGVAKYYKYDLRNSAFQQKGRSVEGFHNRIFRCTPIPLLRFLGSAIYKHLG
jgi:hypothetical protein